MDKTVITGIAMAASFASSAEELYTALSAEKNMSGEVPMPDLGKKKGLAFTDDITKKLYGVYERVTENSGLSDDERSGGDTGIFLGNAMGSVGSIVDFEERAITKGYKSVLPASFINTVMNAPAGQLAILSGTEGINMTFSDGSSASVTALEYGAEMLGDGRIKRAVIGGAEDISPLYEDYIKSRNRLPSGGICLITAELERAAKERGAKIYGAWRACAGAYYDLPSKENIYNVMSRAVGNAGLEREDIDFIITSSVDEGAESEAVLKFGAPYIDMKKVTGEIYGAFGIFAAAAATEIIRRGKLPNGTPLKKGKYALINSVGIDGFIVSFVIEGN